MPQLGDVDTASDMLGNENEIMRNPDKQKLSKMHRWIQLLCGLYTRIALRFGVDRSYVSRVARGERSSEEISRALMTEFDRIQRDAGKIP